MTGPVRVLHVVDDPESAETVASALEGESDRLRVATATSATEGLNRLDAGEFDCVVSAYDLPEQDGVEFLEAVRRNDPDFPFILVAAPRSEEVASEAISAGVSDYLEKQAGESQYALLATRIENAVGKYRAAREIQRTEQRYRRLIEEATDLIVILDEDGRFDYISPAVDRILGYDGDELLGEAAVDNVHPDDVERVRKVLCDGLADPTARPGTEFRFERPDGSWMWLEASARHLRDAPEIQGLVVYTRDITERKKRERELEQYRILVQNVGDPMYILDANGRIVMVNDAFGEVLGYDPDDAVGWSVEKLMPPADVERGVELIRELLEDDERTWDSYEMYAITASGEKQLHETKLAPLTEEGEFVGSVGVFRDISERKERERRLRRQNERLEEFAGVVSHDLRNPLNVAEAYLDLAQDEFESPDLDGVRDALEHMERLIEDLLTLAKQGESVGEVSAVDVEEVVSTCWRNVETAEASLSTELNGAIEADRTRLTQLFENLLRNAIEHGREDVEITIGELEDGFYVEDDGPGIPPDQREKVFDAGYSTTGHGTGFGLSIVRDIAEAHGWEPRLTGGTDGGARFEFRNVERRVETTAN